MSTVSCLRRRTWSARIATVVHDRKQHIERSHIGSNIVALNCQDQRSPFSCFPRAKPFVVKRCKLKSYRVSTLMRSVCDFSTAVRACAGSRALARCCLEKLVMSLTRDPLRPSYVAPHSRDTGCGWCDCGASPIEHTTTSLFKDLHFIA